MIITEKKIRKLRRDPKQFVLDTKAWIFVKGKLSRFIDIDIDTVFINYYNSAKEKMPHKITDKFNEYLNILEKGYFIIKNSDSQKHIDALKNKEKINTYDNFNINDFKRNFTIIGYDKSYTEIMILWQENPWSIKLIKALVFLMEYNERYFDIISILEKSIDSHNNSRDIQLMLIQYLRKAGIYDISRTIDIAESLLRKNSQDIDVRYFLCQFLWESQGLSYALINHIKLLQSQTSKLSANQKAFIYASLCEAGRYNEALEGYLSIRDKLIKKYFILEMIYEIRYTDKNQRIECYNKINSYQTKFENLIKNAKSIAVVGNAPTELGLKKGKIIDGADIVIRFNNYAVGGKYLEDYGSKTDIWVKGGSYLDIRRRDMSQFKGVIQSGNNPLYRNSSFDDFYLEAQVSKVEFTYIPPMVYYDLIEKLNTSPSSGLAILYWIYLIRGKLDKSWIFGFSFGKQKNNTSEHYFSSNNKRGFYPHDWQKEMEVLNSIIKFDE